MTEISGLQRFPYELIAYIVEDLDIEDIFNWSLCNKHFQYLIQQDRFCKRIVLTKVPAALETREALETGGFARALRRIAKRRNALSQASPYVVGIVACADSYEIFGGKLCYIIEERPSRWLRILDVHGPNNWELVVNIPMLIRAALPQAVKSRRYKFRVLYQAAGIVSCLFSFALPDTENWLLILKPQTHQILETFRLESTTKIFVRNNDKFLYFGTHSWMGADGLRKWVIKGFDLSKLCWLPQPRMFLSDMAGCDVGSTACFEIFGEYFYGLSNQSLFEADDLEWTSHYYCFRFPLNDPRLDKTEVMEEEDSLRRKHAEGPIDDRWGFLSLEIDESNKGIVILECRKEWAKGQSTSRRIYYTTEVIFRQQTIQEGQRRVRAATARRMGDRPQSDTIPERRPDYFHVGDDSSVASLLVRSKTYFCTYVRSCHTFVDLIDNTCMDTPGPQRLCLRTGYRRPKPGSHKILEKLASDRPRAVSEFSKQQSMQLYQANTIYTWPPEQDSSGPDPSLDRVRDLLNVNGQQNCVSATGDARSIIYAASDGSKEPKALVLLSFDPATRFEGMKYGGSIVGQRISHDPKEGADPDGAGSSMALHFSPSVPMGATDGTKCIADGPTSLPSWHAALASSAAPSPPVIPDAPEGNSWARYEKAMHLAIGRTLCFSR